MLGYSPENVKKWVDTYETKNRMWGELLNIKSTEVNDKIISAFLEKINKHEKINNGLLSGIEIPTITKEYMPETRYLNLNEFTLTTASRYAIPNVKMPNNYIELKNLIRNLIDKNNPRFLQ